MVGAGQRHPVVAVGEALGPLADQGAHAGGVAEQVGLGDRRRHERIGCRIATRVAAFDHQA
jgi:hypothetical protein